MYKLTNSNSVIRQSDNACIPFAEGNSDYREYLKWLSGGNTPLPVDPPTAEELAAIALQEELRQLQIEAKADAFIQTFVSLSLTEATNYVENNVTDLASAKQLLKRIVQMLLLLAKKEYKQ